MAKLSRSLAAEVNASPVKRIGDFHEDSTTPKQSVSIVPKPIISPTVH